MNIETLDDLYAYGLAKQYSVETELLDALEGLAKDVSTDALSDGRDAAVRDSLRELIEAHRDQTERHVERLEDAFEAIDQDLTEHDAPGLDGFLEEKELFNNVILNDELRPLYYLTFMKQLEQQEIVAYESALQLAEALDLDEGATEPIEATLAEERETLEELEAIASDADLRALREDNGGSTER